MRGTETIPFSDALMEARFRGLASALPAEQVDQVIATLERMEDWTAIAPLTALLRKRR